MWLVAVVSVGVFGAAEDFAPRLAVLERHYDRLTAIPVEPDLEPERQRRLDAAKAALDAGADSEDAFNAIYRALDDARMWLWDHAAERPAMDEGKYADAGGSWTIANDALRLSVNQSTLEVAIESGDYTWRFLPSSDTDIRFKDRAWAFAAAASKRAEPFRTSYSTGMMLVLTGFPEAPDLDVTLGFHLEGSEAIFEVSSSGGPHPLDRIAWPKPVITTATTESVSVIPLMQGMLLPGGWPQDIHKEELCHSRTLYMPWWGQRLGTAGIQTILETDTDAGVRYDHEPGGATVIQPLWHASLGECRYPRRARYVVDTGGSWVAMAKRYRQHVIERGDFVSLAEKRHRTPALDEVIGRPVIHIGALYHFVPEASLYNKDRIEANHGLSTFDELAGGLVRLKRDYGVESAYVHLDGWGFYGYDNGHPDVLPPGYEQGGWEGLRAFADTCRELGYLFAVHDQYRDFYFNAASFDDRLTVLRLDGTREEHSTWCGGPQTILSPRFAPGYVRRNHDLFAQHGVDVRGAYLDVFAVVPLEESAQPLHPMTRAECAEYRRDCFDLLRARGYVVSSEEPADYLVRSLDLVHHGPYGTYPRFGGGDATGIPVPLFSLVYHDAIVLPWEMGDDGGWGIPKGDAGWLHGLLHAGLPYLGFAPNDAYLARVRDMLALNRRLAFVEMVNYAFLDDARRQQRATYADGTTVTVDFDTQTYAIEPPLP